MVSTILRRGVLGVLSILTVLKVLREGCLWCLDSFDSFRSFDKYKVFFFVKSARDFEKVPVTKTPNCARENGRVDRDKIAQNMLVKNEKCP